MVDLSTASWRIQGFLPSAWLRAPIDPIEETVTAGASSLQYDVTAGNYIYVWKTDKAWVGQCRQLTVRLADGSDHTANFVFK